MQNTAQSLSPKQHTKQGLAWIKWQIHPTLGFQMSTAVLILECSCLVAKAKENFTYKKKKKWKQNPVFVFLLHEHGIFYLDGQIHAYYKLVSSWITGFPAKYTESMLF